MRNTTKYNIKVFKPFETDEEYNNWMDNNCRKCNRLQCYTKRVLQENAGKIPIKRAEWIGYDSNGLNNVCRYFNIPNIIHIKGPELEDKFQLNCF